MLKARKILPSAMIYVKNLFFAALQFEQEEASTYTHEN
jgi:hypothetical protein